MEQSVVFLSDVEVLVRFSAVVGFARSAFDESEARLADFALRRGKVRVELGHLTKEPRRGRRCHVRR